VSNASRLIRAWLVTAIVDGIFSSVLAAFVYGSTVTRLWQGVASVLLGKEALQGGTSTAIVGVAMHFGVALTWSAVFLFLWLRSGTIRNAVTSTSGVIKVAAVYGPVIWLAMSLIVIRSLTHRPPTINYRWWVQLIGHVPFVAIPIIASIARPRRR
jgi:hypothetical protein